MKQKELKQSAARVFAGDALRGEKITAQFRRMQKPVVLMGSSTHQIQQSKLEGSVFCVIDRQLNFISDLPKS